MYKVTQVKSGFVSGVWFQEASSAEEAIKSVKYYYASRGGKFIAEEV